MLDYLLNYFSHFLGSCCHSDFSRQPSKIPGSDWSQPRNSPAHNLCKTTNCCFVHLLFFFLLFIISELQGCWYPDFVTFEQSQSEGQTTPFCIPLPHRREQRFPSEWPQTVWPEGLGESEQPLLDLHVVPASYP